MTVILLLSGVSAPKTIRNTWFSDGWDPHVENCCSRVTQFIRIYRMNLSPSPPFSPYIWREYIHGDLLGLLTGCGSVSPTMAGCEWKDQQFRSRSVREAGRLRWLSVYTRILKK